MKCHLPWCLSRVGLFADLQIHMPCAGPGAVFRGRKRKCGLALWLWLWSRMCGSLSIHLGAGMLRGDMLRGEALA
jgi:hypothetical protein